jgi:ferric-dicitrate binding protein FerR (iron transport regulator)
VSDQFDKGNHVNGDETNERALRAGLRAKALSSEAMQRIRAAAEQEWRATTLEAVAPRQRRGAPIAAAASVVAIVAIGWSAWQRMPSAGGDALGQLVRAENPGLAEVQFLRDERVLESGSTLRSGQSLDARGDAVLTLQGGGNARVARASAFAIESAELLRLVRGEIYIDIPPGNRGSAAFVVVTPAGEFLHVGTQFAVALVNGATRLRVREGSVQWLAPGGASTVDAGTEVVIDSNRRVTRRAISTTGRDWSWVESLAPEIDIEDRPVSEFLAWFSRETGRKLIFADEAARTQATSVRMHGNIRGLTAMEALSAVMASTSLRFELPEGAIRVSSAREISAPAS